MTQNCYTSNKLLGMNEIQTHNHWCDKLEHTWEKLTSNEKIAGEISMTGAEFCSYN